MQVVVLLLLVAGLALLVLGLITGSTPLVVGSIAASLLAAMAMFRYRRGEQAGGVATSSEPAVAERPPVLASVSAEAAQVAVPPAHAAAEPDRVAAEPADVPLASVAHAAEPGAAVGVVEADDPADAEPPAADTDPPLRSRGDERVWVIDGRPRYHLPGCAFIIGRGPEPVPLRQAVEDGFTPCALCDPDSGLAAR